MGRQPKVIELPEGLINVRVSMPASLWAYATEVGKSLGIKTGSPGHLGIKLVLDQVAALLEQGDASFLGAAMFEQALQRVRGANLGVLSRVAQEIDLNKLHKNTKLKSGFEGIYANGQGFRAMGRTIMGGVRVIGTFKTAEEAAHRRWLYYKQNNLAYGELETMMDEWRRNAHLYGTHGLDDEALIKAINGHLETTNTWHLVYGPGTCSMAPENVKLPEAPPAPKTGLIGFEDGDIPDALK